MAIDWGKVEQGMGGDSNFKNFAPKGEYKVKLASVEIRDNDNWKSPAMTFNWEETDQYKFPRSATHWLSIPNPAYRQGHNLSILKAFGIEEKKAKELIENVEKDQDRLKLIRAYEDLYKRVASRGVETTITVHDQCRDGKLVKAVSKKTGKEYTPTESDFTAFRARVAEQPKEQPTESTEDEFINPDEIPF